MNLGGDTDTVAAIAGGLAYGGEEIPQEWKDGLLRADFILALFQNLLKPWQLKKAG
mgnify:CR=1 FL=1